MFPRDRVIVALQKYSIAFSDDEPTEALRTKLAEFYAQADDHAPADSAAAIARTRSAGWPATQSAKTTGHVIPVDGGLPEAFLR